MNVEFELELVKTSYTLDQIEAMDLTQVAVAGRSNVGKSSLINSLGRRRNIARISSKPGKTRSLNFFLVNPHHFYLVDLPGYGYAQCSKTEREKWALLIQRYLNGNRALKGVVVLLDSRLTPQELDLNLVSYLRARSIPILPVLTKADKCNTRQRSRAQNTWRELLDISSPPLAVSARTGMNIDKLRGRIVQTALQEENLP
ncbi:MAG: ribosome biogenesis GTP-binding protein YihA/YsxC [Desulfovibrionales bacterium]